MSVLGRLRSLDDLRALSPDDLDQLSSDIREFLVHHVTKTGGHLGPNLGVVELTIALHRVFQSPRDPILWDTGHQSYVHKILTGRADAFTTLRQDGGLSGYPSRAESIHDVIENSHASTALSYADGISKAFQLNNESDRHVVAVVGDGALTGGMTWEAINNIAESDDRSLIMVVNDNERSYSPTIGGLANQLAGLRTNRTYEKVLGWGKSVLGRTPVVGAPMYDALHGLKKGIKDMVSPQGLFEDLGVKYIGPVNGHNIPDLEFALAHARDFGGPVIVHVITEKGRGYAPAEQDEADRFHAVGVVNPETGQPLSAAGPSWTSVFSEAMVSIGEQRQDIVAITAAMLGPTGLAEFQRRFPGRTFDVGIAEQHAVTSAVGMAHAGLHPVVAIYSTFLNRAFDQVLMDCAMHSAGVTFILDRAGITGDDGASHNGMWDMSLLSIVPGLELFAPRDGRRLSQALTECVTKSDHPTVIRFPKGAVPADIESVETMGRAELLMKAALPDVTFVSIGALAPEVMSAAALVMQAGFSVEVIDPVKIFPIDPALVDALSTRTCVITIEDGLVEGGAGQALLTRVHEVGSAAHTKSLGIPKSFLRHAPRKTLLQECGLDAAAIATEALNQVRLSVR